MEEPDRGIRAVYTPSTVTVYQAYSPEIGVPAVRESRFPTTWKRDRMTWVYPSDPSCGDVRGRHPCRRCGAVRAGCEMRSMAPRRVLNCQ